MSTENTMKKDEKTAEKETTEKKSIKGKVIGLLILALVLAGGAGVGFYFLNQSTNYLTTDNARVTTNLVHISANAPGTLERFNLYEGQTVSENDVLGWVENGEPLRSPVNGMVIHTIAVQDQTVSPLEPLAVIADTGRLHIQANIEETDIMRLQLGHPAIVTIDGLGNQQFSGYVAEIGRITQAELGGHTLFFNTGGNFTRVTHHIPIEINITDDVDLSNMIGVNARVRIPLRESTVVTPTVQQDNITSTGVVESVTSRNIYSTLGFTIDRVYAEVGDFVQEGQVLAVLDTADLVLTIAQQQAAIQQARETGQLATTDAQRMLNEAAANLAAGTNMHVLGAESALSAANSGLEMAQIAYTNAQNDAQIVNARNTFTNAQTDYNNTRSLYNAGVATTNQMRQAETTLTSARLAYDNAVELHERSLEQARTALDSAITTRQNSQEMLSAARTAAGQEIERLRSHAAVTVASTSLEHMELVLEQLERSLNDAVITASVSGTVTQVTAREGAVGAGLMFTVEDTNDLRIITSFREHDLSNIYEGMEVAITADATGDVVHNGVITRINPAATADSPIVEFEVEVTVSDSASTGLRIGMSARVIVD